MATRYVRTSGSDGAAGTSPAAAWATLGKLLGASGIQSGEQAWIGAGTYREVVTVAMTSAVAETKITADVDGSQTGDAGPVIWTAYTTNDTTAPSATTLLNLAGRDFLTFEGFYLVSSSANFGLVDAYTTPNAQNITFRACQFNAGTGANIYSIIYKGVAGAAANWLVDRCIFAPQNTFQIYGEHPSQGAGGDYDLNFTVQNCLFFGNQAGANVYATGTGGLAGKAYGYKLYNCTSLGSTRLFEVADANHSTTNPSTVYNCSVFGGGNGIKANTLGQIVENYNFFLVATPRTNVNPGANTVVSPNMAPMIGLGYSELSGLLPRMFATPFPGSPILGFGNQAGGPAVDFINRPRPAGGASTSYAVGYMERHDTAVKETSVTDAGSVGLKITGPGDHDFRVPVNAAATVLSVRVRYDTNHGTGNKPQAILLAAPDIGVTTQTVTATVGVDTWENLVFSSITPTAKGFVIIRLVSRAAAGSGIAYFDTLVAPDIDLGDFGHFSRGEPGTQVSGAGTGGGLIGAGSLQGGMQ